MIPLAPPHRRIEVQTWGGVRDARMLNACSDNALASSAEDGDDKRSERYGRQQISHADSRHF